MYVFFIDLAFCDKKEIMSYHWFRLCGEEHILTPCIQINVFLSHLESYKQTLLALVHIILYCRALSTSESSINLNLHTHRCAMGVMGLSVHRARTPAVGCGSPVG